MNQKFPKSQKLKSAKTIGELFSSGKQKTVFPVKVFYDFLPESGFSKAAFAVPKRNFRLATDRNRIKRQMREAYRRNKHFLEEDHGQYVFLFLYLGRKKPDYSKLESAFLKIFEELKPSKK